MKVVILGSTGMIGKGVLLECLADNNVEKVLAISRKPVNVGHDKLKVIIHDNFFDFSALKDQLKPYDTCLFCLGISSVGLSEDRYREITYDIALNFASTFVAASPGSVFCYISGAGTDGSEKGGSMWARIKGRTENALMNLPFRNSYMFRPGYIQPLKGVRPTGTVLRTMYIVFKPLYLLLKPFGNAVTDTVSLGRAMINAALKGYDKKILGVRDINILART